MHLPRHVILAAVVAIAALAGAAGAEVRLEARTIPADPADPKAKGKAPTLEIAVVGGSPLEAKAYQIKQTDKAMSGLTATKVIPYLEGPDPVALVVVVLVDGNYLNASQMLEGVSAGIHSLAAAGPPGSLATVITYADGAAVALAGKPLADLATFQPTPGPAGPKAARSLVAGLKLGVAELEKLAPKRKVLVVIGDAVEGSGTAAANGEIRDLGRQLTDKGVKAFALVNQINANAFPFGQPVPPMVIDPETKQEVPDTEAVSVETKNWRLTLSAAIEDAKFLTTERVAVVSTRTGFASAADGVVGELADRFYVQFPGYDPRTKVGLTWDGKSHPLLLRAEGSDLGTLEAVLEPKWSTGGGGTPVWLFIVIPVALIGADAAVWKLTRKSTPAPAAAAAGAPGGAPVPGGPAVFGVPATAPGAPPPGGGAGKPMKTQFINLAGDDVFPVVAWMVFLNGPQRFKTHKLAAGVTKIGTAKESDIPIDDGYMSTNHAIVVMSPDGFILQDNSSRNGTVVNGQRISKHELMDGDVCVFGQTQVKFKATI